MGDGNVGRVVFGTSYGIGKTARTAIDILLAAEKERIDVAQKEADRNKCAECEEKDLRLMAIKNLIPALKSLVDISHHQSSTSHSECLLANIDDVREIVAILERS